MHACISTPQMIFNANENKGNDLPLWYRSSMSFLWPVVEYFTKVYMPSNKNSVLLLLLHIKNRGWIYAPLKRVFIKNRGQKTIAECENKQKRFRVKANKEIK